MATAIQIRAACDTKLANLWTAVQSREDAYLAANGHYWQGLRTASVVPADGVTVAPDVGTATPTDQPDPWPAALLSSTFPMAVQIDVYNGPSGMGYTATLTVVITGNTWQRVANVGPETWRAQPWTQQVAP